MTFCSKTCFNIIRNQLKRHNSEYSLTLRLDVDRANFLNFLMNFGDAFRKDIIIRAQGGQEWVVSVGKAGQASETGWKECIQGDWFTGRRPDLGTSLKTYWKTDLTGIDRLLKYFGDLFSKPIDHLIYDPSVMPQQPYWVLETLNSQQSTLESAKITMRYLSDEKKFLSMLQLAKNLELNLNYSDGNFLCPVEWSCEKLVLKMAFYMQLDQLLRINCKDLTLEGCNLEDTDWNSYLKSWLAGAVPKIENLSVEWSGPKDMDIVMNGIESQPNADRVLEKTIMKNHTRTMSSVPLDITKNDGTIGTIFYSMLVAEEDHYQLFELNFVVWK